MAAVAGSGPNLDTPAMRQYRRFKDLHPGCILLFRMGDFYEMFFEDAVLAHRELGVTLTQRTEGVPMAGVPYHAVESYLRKLIVAGHRVAVCDQVEDAAQAKGVVKRDVTRVVTPGTLTDEALLDEQADSPLAAVAWGAAKKKGNGDGDAPAAVAWVDLSAGGFWVMDVPADQLEDELERIGPSELLFCQTADGQTPPRVRTLADQLGCPTTGRPAWQYRLDEAARGLREHFGVARLDGFGMADDDAVVQPAGAVLAYLLETQGGGKREAGSEKPEAGDADEPTSGGGVLPHLRPPRRFGRDEHLVVDRVSLRALEVTRTLRDDGPDGSLLGLLQKSQGPVTAMGKRRLRQWLCYPLRDGAAIRARQDVVQALVDDSRFERELRGALDKVHDVPRVVARLSVNRAAPRDLVAVGRSARVAQTLAGLLDQRPSCAGYQQRLAEHIEPLTKLADRLESACVASPPAHMREGGLIADGFDKQLDEARTLQRDSHQWLARYQQHLAEQADIPSLKVGYNKVFGYYIELTATHRDKAPDAWTRKQTLKNAERFITPELKEFEGRVLTADQRAIEREQLLFGRLCGEACGCLEPLHELGEVIAELDVLGGFARRAIRQRHVRPELIDGPTLQLTAARHPVLDELLGESYVPNDVHLGRTAEEADAEQSEASGPSGDKSLGLITGPNMAGKSTYIRTAALLTLLAHTGSFVPADAAVVGLTDRIFTRVGAADELHSGQSTFMVEMVETANICHHATDRSLVILDEIGRGTSTLDGLSLAWAIAEHLAGRGCRTLFATHYHELTQLADRLPAVGNLHVTVREWQDQVVFLHRVEPGATDRSYGVHVARLAGLPDAVVQRADQLLGELAVTQGPAPGTQAGAAPTAPSPSPQMSLFTEYLDHPVVQQLRDTPLDTLSPMQAFDLLRQLQQEAGDPAKPV
jgi:DNA mismatch repair protein MutS